MKRVCLKLEWMLMDSCVKDLLKKTFGRLNHARCSEWIGACFAVLQFSWCRVRGILGLACIFEFGQARRQSELFKPVDSRGRSEKLNIFGDTCPQLNCSGEGRRWCN